MPNQLLALTQHSMSHIEDLLFSPIHMEVLQPERPSSPLQGKTIHKYQSFH